jgi:hypothetical protein
VRYRSGPIFWGLVLIGLGVLSLAQQLSNGQFDAGELLRRWWPLLLVLLGLWLVLQALVGSRWTGGGVAWGAGPTGPGSTGPGPTGPAPTGPGRSGPGSSERLSLDLGGATDAQIEVAFGAGELVIGRAPPGKLMEGSFDGGVRPEIRGPGRVRLGREVELWGWGPGRWPKGWHFGVTGEVPLSLRVETGASRNELDLSDLRVSDLIIRSGAAKTILRLPRAAGSTRARIDTGAASIRIFVPPEVALRIVGRMQLGTNDIDTTRFPPTATGWSSPDFDGAANRVELAISGGLATLQVQ